MLLKWVLLILCLIIFFWWIPYGIIYWIWVGLSKLFKILVRPMVDETIAQHRNDKSTELHLLDIKVKQKADELRALESQVLQAQSEIDAYPNTIEYKRKKGLEEDIYNYNTLLQGLKNEGRTLLEDVLVNLFEAKDSMVYQYLFSEYGYYSRKIWRYSHDVSQQDLIEEIYLALAKARNELSTLRQDIVSNIPKVVEEMPEFHADLKARLFDMYGNILLSKSHPAQESALYLKNEAKREIREATKKWKEAQYNYEYLKAQIEEKISDDVDFEEIESTTEEVKDSEEKWLSKEEYARLDETERSGLALQRYIQRHKSRRQIGRDYEEYIAYLFRKQNGFSRCNIEMYGQLKGFDDLGRDIVVRNRGKLYIVQCKRWSKDRFIRENAIMQLFGTVCEYCLEHRIDPMTALNKNVYAVFCATTQFSDTAQRFAQILGIKFYQVEQGEYPRIKCNINNTTREKIYHLPFDQQYNNIKIEFNKGECMAMTVQEAVAKGFRRAKRHNFNE